MAGICLLNIFVILIIVNNCASRVLNNDSEEELLRTEGELYESQKAEFSDALGYGYLIDDRNYDDGVKREAVESSKSDGQSQHDTISGANYVRKRSASGSDPYGLIAGISGGSVIHASKDNISKAVDIISSVTLTNPVIVTRKQLKVNGLGLVPFYVDTSITKLALEIKTSCCKPQKLIVTDPAGNNLTTTSENVTLKVDTTSMTYVDVSRSFVPGNWILTIYDLHNQNYDVIIHGSSVIDFDLAFSDSFGMTVSGQPVPDSNSTYVKVTPLGNDMVSNWTYLLMESVNGSLLQKLSLGALRESRTSKAFLVPVVWPNMDVHVGVLGQDKDGNTFTRDQETLVMPVGIRIKLNNSDEELIRSCFNPLVVPFTITNTGPSGNFSLQAITDNTNFLAKISPNVVKLDSFSTVRGHCDVTLTSTPSSDQSTQVVLSVTDSASKSQYVTKTIIANGVTCSSSVSNSSMLSSTTKQMPFNLFITTAHASTSSRMRLNSILTLIMTILTLISVSHDNIILQ